MNGVWSVAKQPGSMVVAVEPSTPEVVVADVDPSVLLPVSVLEELKASEVVAVVAVESKTVVVVDVVVVDVCRALFLKIPPNPKSVCRWSHLPWQ